LGDPCFSGDVASGSVEAITDKNLDRCFKIAPLLSPPPGGRPGPRPPDGVRFSFLLPLVFDASAFKSGKLPVMVIN
jgi:hypothetical protein